MNKHKTAIIFSLILVGAFVFVSVELKTLFIKESNVQIGDGKDREMLEAKDGVGNLNHSFELLLNAESHLRCLNHKNSDNFWKEYLRSEPSLKSTIITFWASWCGPCVSETPSLLSLVGHHEGDIYLVAISQDTNLDDVNAFMKSFDFSKPNVCVIWDSTGDLASKFGVDKLPESFIYTSKPKTIKRVVGSISWNESDFFSYLKSLK